MLAELEPSVELTGGSWYTDNVMDVEFIDQLSMQIFKYIHSKSKPPTATGALFPISRVIPTAIDDIHDFITTSGLTSHSLSIDDIQSLVNRLIYDGAIHLNEEGVYSSIGSLYKTIKGEMRLGMGFTDIPCGTCPVFDFCSDDSPVSPATCIYYKDWLADF
jgi:DNA-directed RNA polymerase III subunit RPC6